MSIATVDVGNTTVDILLWEGSEVKDFLKLSHEEFKKLKPIDTKAVVVSVRRSLDKYIMDKFKDVKIVKTSDIPIEVLYKTPDTLGVDRVVMAFSAREFYGNNTIIVSAGTALVVDLVLEGKFMGGFITLGIRKKLETLSKVAEGIPNISPEYVNVDIGRSTKECILGGILKESKAFINQVINLWKNKFGRDFKIVVTGGDGEFFGEFGVCDKYLIHRGLKKLINSGLPLFE
ncbi:type III pantothenate kinase [Aquifex sp.]